MSRRLNIQSPLENLSLSILGRAFEASRSPLVITDNQLPDNPVIYCNQAFVSLTGFPLEDIIGHNCRFLQQPGTDKKDIKKIKRAIQKGESIRLTLKNYMRSGREFYNDLCIVPLKDEVGKVTHFVGMQVDVTERVLTEQRLQAKTKELAQKSDALQKEELNRQKIQLLAEQKRQLIRLNRAKDEFVSIASHQLRTPATAVKQYIGMIIEGFVEDVTPRQLDLLRSAYESNERELIVIDELLKTAQLDSSRFKLDLKRENLNRLVKECIKALRPQTELRKQQVHFFADTEYFAVIDRVEIKLVIQNVIENASKYTPPGKSITVTLDRGKKKVNIRIKDEGVGIQKSDQKLIFEKFSRVNNELSDTVSGSGLGLYWAKRIMKLHKGTLRVGSKPGEGSEFVIGVPI